MIRVTIIAMEYPPVTGGAGTALKTMIEGTVEVRNKYDVNLHVIAPYHDCREYTHQISPRAKVTRLPAGKKMGRKGRLRAAMRYWWEATRYCSFRNSADLYHVWGGGPGLYAVPGNKPYIVTLHGSDVPGRNPARNHLWRWAFGYRDRLQKADCVTAVTPKLRQMAESYLDRVVEYIPNGVNVRDFKHELHDPPRVLVVTRLTPLKRLGLLSQVISWCRDFQFTVVGDGPERKYCEQWAMKNVRWVGWQKNVAPFYADHDILLNVAEVTGVSMAMLEAIGHGLPVVSTPIPGEPAPRGGPCFQVAARPDDIRSALWGISADYHNKAAFIKSHQDTIQWSIRAEPYYELYQRYADAKK